MEFLTYLQEHMPQAAGQDIQTERHPTYWPTPQTKTSTMMTNIKTRLRFRENLNFKKKTWLLNPVTLTASI